ncbi:MAG: helix-turn-helix domain-containing protein [Actinomycetota bacterium]|nr:helix-turn-helix domain-containing protein [Actinomycetota bacterium]
MSTNQRVELLADRTRVRLLRTLAERGTVSIQELADAASVHLNTARARLSGMEEAGIVLRATAPAQGRGRPTVRYRLAEGWRLPSTDYLGLAELLAAIVLRVVPDEKQIQAIGRDWGRYLTGRPGIHQLDVEIPRAMEQLGFDATVVEREVRLSACPCPLIMPGRPEVLCHLATAVIDGMLDSAGSELTVVDGRHDPQRRVCALRLRTSARTRGSVRPRKQSSRTLD